MYTHNTCEGCKYIFMCIPYIIPFSLHELIPNWKTAVRAPATKKHASTHTHIAARALARRMSACLSCLSMCVHAFTNILHICMDVCMHQCIMYMCVSIKVSASV